MESMKTTLDPATWNEGLTYADYRRSVEKNGDVFDEVYETPAHAEGDLEVLRLLPPLRVVAIGEDWCPDVYNTLPTWARIADALDGWELRVFPRDRHPDLMDAFLWKGRAKRIPVYAFLDERLALQAWWSGRGREAQAALDGVTRGRGYDELDDDERAEAGRVLREGYPRRYRRESFEEVLALLRAFHHV